MIVALANIYMLYSKRCMFLNFLEIYPSSAHFPKMTDVPIISVKDRLKNNHKSNKWNTYGSRRTKWLSCREAFLKEKDMEKKIKIEKVKRNINRLRILDNSITTTIQNVREMQEKEEESKRLSKENQVS